MDDAFDQFEPIDEHMTLAELAVELHGSDSGRSEEAAEVLGRVDGGEGILISAIRDPDPFIRACAAQGLRWYSSPHVVSALCALLGDDDDDVLRNVCISLSVIGNAAYPAIDALIDLLGKGLDGPSDLAAYALGKIGPAAASASSALIEAIRRSRDVHPQPQVVCYAVESLGLIGYRDPAMIPLLVGLLRADDSPLACAAAEALAGLGSAAEEAAPALRDFLHCDDVSIQANMAAALAKIDAPEEMARFLIDLAEQGDGEAQDEAVSQFLHLGAIGAPALPLLQRLRDDPEIGMLATEAIRRIEADLEAAIPAE